MLTPFSFLLKVMNQFGFQFNQLTFIGVQCSLAVSDWLGPGGGFVVVERDLKVCWLKMGEVW